jgi:hypothetical protein
MQFYKVSCYSILGPSVVLVVLYSNALSLQTFSMYLM